MKLCVGGLKGGAGKTATAVHLALGLCREGRTLLVDSDPEQPQALEWSEQAEDWPADRCTVIHVATRDLGRRVAPMVGDYAHVVFDMGAKNPGLLRQALSLSDDLVIPSRPTGGDLRELDRVFDIAAEIDAVHPVRAVVLLTQVRSGTTNEEEARELLDEQDMPVMTARVRMLKRYEVALGTAPADLGDYEDVLKELTA